VTLPIAGWYPDPQDPSQTRWWDGARWGQLAPRTEPQFAAPYGGGGVGLHDVPRPPAPSEYHTVHQGEPVLRGRKARAAKDRATRAANPFGYAGLVLALVAFIFNVFAIPGILGIVFGAVGLARAGQLTGSRVTGFGVSLAAVILGVATSAFFAVRAAQLLG
jgi:hypothetical protein